MYEELMREAIREAEKAFNKDEIPVGAVIVRDNQIISKAHNNVEKLNNPFGHAEIIALQEAAKILNTPNLSGCELVVTLEPCAMCAGALINAKIKRLIFGAVNHKYGAVITHIKLLDISTFNHKVEVVYPILPDECAEIISQFFKNKRNKE